MKAGMASVAEYAPHENSGCRLENPGNEASYPSILATKGK
jgi:hypothetical protein